MKLSVLILFALTLSSCSEKSNKSFEKIVEGNIFSNRSQRKYESSLIMVKLKSPPLFETAAYEDGKIVLKEGSLDQIKKEQKEFLEKAKLVTDQIEVLYNYKYTLNGFTLKVPSEHANTIESLAEVDQVKAPVSIAAPKATQTLNSKSLKKAIEKTSVNFIGVDQVQVSHSALGQGVHVGILDTGIDYTHKMFGGVADVEVFKSIDPKKDAPVEHYPNDKVVGGVDLVGDNYTPGSVEIEKRFPKPDNNPIDISGHGSHVAGTVAGLAAGEDSYDGVAPQAKLHAIKVFGGGGTGDYIVIAGFEYAADPNGDGNPDDALDVLNLSLGGAYGIPGNMYESAISNLAKVGITVVASAGNSGDVSYITGAPATSNDAISTAAGIDHMDHNWKFEAVSFSSENLEQKVLSEFSNALFTPGLDSVEELSGKLVYAGLADQDFSEELKDQIKGNIALIDRGKETFFLKVKRAQDAGAIAVVVANNKDDGVMRMSGPDGESLKTIAIMIDLNSRNKIKAAMDQGDVIANLKESDTINKEERIDTLTSFSSRGPRSLDSAIKPEIVAPGQQIISAKAGGGDAVTRMNGTSMSGPHMAGVMALMKQLYPKKSVVERKAIVIGSAKPIVDQSKNLYPVSRQGGGRVQVEKAANANGFLMPATLSLGQINIKKGIVLRKTLELNNITEEDLTFKTSILSQKKMKISLDDEINVKANSKAEVKLRITIAADELEQVDELDAFIQFTANEKTITIPVLAVVKSLSQIASESLEILGSEGASQGAAVDLILKNNSNNSGVAYIFNKLIDDSRRELNNEFSTLRNSFCDLQSAGYRVVSENGEQFLEVAVKTYAPQETWAGCQPSLLIDSDLDGKADQELVGATNSSINGLTQAAPQFAAGDYNSFLIDFNKARQARAAYEEEALTNPGASFSMVSSVLDLAPFVKFNHATVTILKVRISSLAKTSNGTVQFQLALDGRDYQLNESDDYAGDVKNWTSLNLFEDEMAFVDIPSKVELNGGESKTIELTKGLAEGDLIIYYPYNYSTQSVVIEDLQQEVVKPKYAF